MFQRYTRAAESKWILAFLNLDHIGGINTLLHTVFTGGMLIAVEERTPEEVFRAIQKHKVQVFPTTPTFLNMVVLSGVWERYDTQSLELITYGTEPMPKRTLKELAHVLPKVRFKQTYGLSELGILPSRSQKDGSLWMKMGAPDLTIRWSTTSFGSDPIWRCSVTLTLNPVSTSKDSLTLKTLSRRMANI